MRIPEFVQAVLTQFEGESRPFNEAEVYDALRNARKAQGDLSQEDFEGLRAEAAAFFFYERRDRDSPWGTYFAPTFTGTRNDGIVVHHPDIKDLNADVVHHWEDRAKASKNPVLRARYADLVWDLKQAITSQRPDVEYARMAIDSYVEATVHHFYTSEVEGIQWVERALDLARSISDQKRVKQVVDFMFEFYDRIANPQYAGRWLFLFDNLYGKKGLIAADQEERIIANLEDMLAKVSNEVDEGSFNPHNVEAAGKRLASHYQRKGDLKNVKRVIKTYGGAFETAAREADPLLATLWLQPVIEKYQQAGLKADAERVQLASLEKAKNIEGSMAQISAEVQIPHEELEKYLDWFTGGDLNSSLLRIAVNFIPDVNDARKFLLHTNQEFPLQALFSVAKIDEGQIVATAGSVQDDEEGQLHMQLAQNIQFSQPFLVEALHRMRVRYKPTVEQYLDFLYQSPVFDESARNMISEGLIAYEKEDFVKAVHVLIPQTERALRNLLGILGIPVNKQVRDQPGIMQMKNINDILADEQVRHSLSENLWRYFQVFLADKRGLNLRNRVAHGLISVDECNRHVADQVLHVLLTLSLIRATNPSGESV
ncbi:MAG: hypothetical protein A3H27_05855 [Acidobacteria bacterium RIFCSPLOWO2_02_FULL_59_13]|nr:MAG: hypothetical protein A3H27_05855 [Acidobacteria bacterium RIFCSPLOWO2_02_FULL_59_13]